MFNTSSPVFSTKRKVVAAAAIVVISSWGGMSAASALTLNDSIPADAKAIIELNMPEFAGTEEGGANGAGKTFGESHIPADAAAKKAAGLAHKPAVTTTVAP